MWKYITMQNLRVSSLPGRKMMMRLLLLLLLFDSSQRG